MQVSPLVPVISGWPLLRVLTVRINAATGLVASGCQLVAVGSWTLPEPSQILCLPFVTIGGLLNPEP